MLRHPGARSAKSGAMCGVLFVVSGSSTSPGLLGGPASRCPASRVSSTISQVLPCRSQVCIAWVSRSVPSESRYQDILTWTSASPVALLLDLDDLVVGDLEVLGALVGLVDELRALASAGTWIGGDLEALPAHALVVAAHRLAERLARTLAATRTRRATDDDNQQMRLHAFTSTGRALLAHGLDRFEIALAELARRDEHDEERRRRR